MLETRFIDSIGRIRIPRKIGRALGYKPKTQTDCQRVEVTLEFGKICIRKFEKEGFEKRANVGLIRPVDINSRVVIPPEYRNILGIDEYSPIDGEVDYESETIRFWKAA